MKSFCSTCSSCCRAMAAPPTALIAAKRPLVSSSSSSSVDVFAAPMLTSSSLLTSAATIAPSNTCTLNGIASSTSLPLRQQLRHQHMTGALPSPIMGPVKPYQGFFSDDVVIDISNFGGQYARGLFAKRKIAYGREIMRVPAFATYIGPEERREQVFILAQQILKEVVARGEKDPYTTYVKERVFTLMSSGKQYFLREQDLQRLIDSVPGAGGFLDRGIISPTDVQRLPQQIDFNRYDVEFRDKKGICIFPEASYFNHMCTANVEITIEHDITQGFVLSARTCRPVEAGDELFINYIPGNDLPMSRFILAMRNRWGFECTCAVCKKRMMGMALMLVMWCALPVMAAVRYAFEDRFRERARKLG